MLEKGSDVQKFNVTYLLHHFHFTYLIYCVMLFSGFYWPHFFSVKQLNPIAHTILFLSPKFCFSCSITSMKAVFTHSQPSSNVTCISWYLACYFQMWTARVRSLMGVLRYTLRLLTWQRMPPQFCWVMVPTLRAGINSADCLLVSPLWTPVWLTGTPFANMD